MSRRLLTLIRITGSETTTVIRIDPTTVIAIEDGPEYFNALTTVYTLGPLPYHVAEPPDEVVRLYEHAMADIIPPVAESIDPPGTIYVGKTVGKSERHTMSIISVALPVPPGTDVAVVRRRIG